MTVPVLADEIPTVLPYPLKERMDAHLANGDRRHVRKCHSAPREDAVAILCLVTLPALQRFLRPLLQWFIAPVNAGAVSYPPRMDYSTAQSLRSLFSPLRDVS